MSVGTSKSVYWRCLFWVRIARTAAELVGVHRKGKRGRDPAGKMPVFGILKRGGKVYTKVIPDTKTKTLLPIIGSKICSDSIVYTDIYSSYDALDVSD